MQAGMRACARQSGPSKSTLKNNLEGLIEQAWHIGGWNIYRSRLMT